MLNSIHHFLVVLVVLVGPALQVALEGIELDTLVLFRPPVLMIQFVGRLAIR